MSQGSDDGYALAGANFEENLAASENSVINIFFAWAWRSASTTDERVNVKYAGARQSARMADRGVNARSAGGLAICEHG